MTTPNVKPITSAEAVLRLHASTWDLAGAVAAALRCPKTAARFRLRRDLKLTEADAERQMMTAPPARYGGRHRVYLPGPITGKPEVIEHDGCVIARCPIEAALAERTAKWGQKGWQVQGEYFTTDGKDFVRCEFQPWRRP